MKEYVVEYLKNGNQYMVEVFTDYTIAIGFYDHICKREWAKIS